LSKKNSGVRKWTPQTGAGTRHPQQTGPWLEPGKNETTRTARQENGKALEEKSNANTSQGEGAGKVAFEKVGKKEWRK